MLRNISIMTDNEYTVSITYAVRITSYAIITITWSALRQVQSHLKSEFSIDCYLILPISKSIVLSFP